MEMTQEETFGLLIEIRCVVLSVATSREVVMMMVVVVVLLWRTKKKKEKKNPSTPGRDFLPLIPGEIKGKSTVQSTRHR